MNFYLTHLYPNKMNIYGDLGNIIALNYRLERLGIQVIYQPLKIGQSWYENNDFIFIGGGQDSEQWKVSQDLLGHKSALKDEVERGVPLLSICGGMQLLGQRFVTGKGKQVPGIEIFDILTEASSAKKSDRMLGNIVTKCLLPGMQKYNLVGFENHSGKTVFTHTRTQPLGKVIYGSGNNGSDKTEGCFYKNAIGTYLHGSILPKNPELANYLIVKAVEAKRGKDETSNSSLNKTLDFRRINDTIAAETHETLIRSILN